MAELYQAILERIWFVSRLMLLFIGVRMARFVILSEAEKSLRSLWSSVALAPLFSTQFCSTLMAQTEMPFVLG